MEGKIKHVSLVEEVQDVRTATEHGYTTIWLNGKAVAHVDKTLDGRYLLTWDVPSVNRLDYTDSLENAVKTVLYAFNKYMIPPLKGGFLLYSNLVLLIFV